MERDFSEKQLREQPRKGSQWSHAARLLQTLQEDYLRSAGLAFGDPWRKKSFSGRSYVYISDEIGYHYQ